VKKWQQIQRLKEKGWVDASTVMIGDRAVDIEAAHRNGLPGAGVLWGHGSREEIGGAPGASAQRTGGSEMANLKLRRRRRTGPTDNLDSARRIRKGSSF